MNGLQMMLVLAALTLLSVLVLTLNRGKLFSDQQVSNAEYVMAATAVGQTLINEIATKKFDAATVKNPDAEISSFTAPRSLGHGAWESYPSFNDVDDFNGYTTTVRTPRTGDFRLSSRVQYVDAANPDTPVKHRTHTKRVTVTISSPLMEHPVTLTYFKRH